MNATLHGTTLVMRGTNADALDAVELKVRDMLVQVGVTPH